MVVKWTSSVLKSVSLVTNAIEILYFLICLSHSDEVFISHYFITVFNHWDELVLQVA